MGLLGSRTFMLVLGAGTGMVTYHFMQDGVWNRAEVAARGIAKLQQGVPGMDSPSKIERPETFTTVRSAFDGEFSAKMWNKFAKSWNYGVLSVRQGVDDLMSGQDKPSNSR